MALRRYKYRLPANRPTGITTAAFSEPSTARQSLLAAMRGGYITRAEAEETFYANLNTLDMVA